MQQYEYRGYLDSRTVCKVWMVNLADCDRQQSRARRFSEAQKKGLLFSLLQACFRSFTDQVLGVEKMDGISGSLWVG